SRNWAAHTAEDASKVGVPSEVWLPKESILAPIGQVCAVNIDVLPRRGNTFHRSYRINGGGKNVSRIGPITQVVGDPIISSRCGRYRRTAAPPHEQHPAPCPDRD